MKPPDNDTAPAKGHSRFGRIAIVVALLGLGLAAACTSNEAASPKHGFAGPALSEVLVITNAQVYTVHTDRPWAEAFAVDTNGRIIAIGSNGDVLVGAGDDATVIDADGAMILPGFQDIHVHVPEAGLNAELCFLEGDDLDWLETLAKECADDQPEAEWVLGAGASLFNLRNTDELPIDVLDRAIPDRPALILDDLGHAVWTNSLGLQAAGIGPNDPDPQGGVFHRDPDTGLLTGLLLEDAQQLVRNAAAPDDETILTGLLDAAYTLSRSGITSVSDAGGYWAQNHPEAWQQALADGSLSVRAANSLYVYPSLDTDEQLAEFESRFANDSDMLRFDTAKIYVDGILDLGTASLLQPYDIAIDPLYPTGFNYFEPNQLRTYVYELHAMGYRISFHAIGDQAVRDALDAIEAIDDSPINIADRRHRMTHTYMVHPDDLARFASLGVIADFQQSEDAVTTDYHEFLFEFIGDRAFNLLPTAQLLEAGATVTLSSDWDAGPLPPLGTIQRSLQRQTLGRDTNAVPDLETAIAMSTINAAYALGHDDDTGSIEVGKFADFVVLDQNLFDLDPSHIASTQVLATFIAGRATYESPDWNP